MLIILVVVFVVYLKLLECPVAEIWRRVWGDRKKLFADQDFTSDGFFRKKFPIYDDPFFSHRPGFSDFTFLYCIKCRIRPFLHKKNHYFRKEFLDKTIFLLCSCFPANPTTLLL